MRGTATTELGGVSRRAVLRTSVLAVAGVAVATALPGAARADGAATSHRTGDLVALDGLRYGTVVGVGARHVRVRVIGRGGTQVWAKERALVQD